MKIIKFSLIVFVFFSDWALADEQRIITIGASITEIVAELGLENQIVARDITSTRPGSIVSTANLGQAHHISTEAVLTHRPTLVLMSSGLINRRLKNDLKQLDIRTHIIDDGEKLSDIPLKIKAIGKAVLRTDRAKEIVSSLPKRQPMKSNKALRLAFLYARGPQHTFMAGTETTAHQMIQELGHTNAFENMEGFKPISAEALINANPEVILIQETSQYQIDELWKTPGIQMTRAYQQQAIVFVDTLAFLGLSLQTIDELNRISRALNEGS